MGIIIFILIMLVCIGTIPGVFRRLKRIMPFFFRKRVAAIFEPHYIECKAYYVYRFRIVPSATLIDDIDITKSFAHIQNRYKDEINSIYQSCYYNHAEKMEQFSRTLFVLKNKLLIELGGSYARILYPGYRQAEAGNLLKALSAYKLPEKQEDFEINIITLSANGLELKPLSITPSQLDIGLYYNDDFEEADRVIKERLSKQNDKGIVLLHGLPGTGKTTYLRHLIGSMKKKILFVSPSVAGNLMNPEFIDLLIDNPNAILVIEDAENIMMDRKHNSNSSVSNLLNLSDGLLSDCLNVQIICTFNSSLQLIDQALMRKGRLIARYEFGKLTVEKAAKLSAHLGFDTVIEKPMTLADITNPDTPEQQTRPLEVIGFRRQEVMMN
jgi:ATPase family associated with various cellular activities (AAA)